MGAEASLGMKSGGRSIHKKSRRSSTLDEGGTRETKRAIIDLSGKVHSPAKWANREEAMKKACRRLLGTHVDVITS